MSSFTGNITAPVDNTLQLAPEGDDGPDFNAIKTAFEKAKTDNLPFADQCRLNFEVRYAIWPGQTSDGKKHAREGSKIDPTPWEGASDLRVFLVDDAINTKVAMECMAFHKANLVAVPIEGNDNKRAKIVSNFMRWLIQTQIPDVDREVELLSNYKNEKGVAVTGQFWEVIQEKTLTLLKLEDFQKQFPQLDMQRVLSDPEMKDSLSALFEEVYGCSGKKAKKMISELRKSGETSVGTIGKRRSRPVIRAFNLDENLIIPQFTGDLEKATGIWRIEYYTPEILRAMVKNDGWDEAWVEDAIKTMRGQLINPISNEYSRVGSRNFVNSQQRFSDLIGVVYGYQRLSDEDGVPGIYLTIFNPNLPAKTSHPGYAKFGLLGYAHGQYPFVLHRREFLSRRLHDSRGIPEPGKPWQDQIKAHKDGRIDAASISICPPLFYPLGRPPVRWGAGSRIPERRPNEYHHGASIPPDFNTNDSEDRLSATFKEYNGFASREGDPTLTPLKNQHEADKFMRGWAKAFNQVWHLYKQYGDDKVFFRVVGLRQADPTLFDKGDLDEEFNFYLSWDVQSMDFEQMAQKVQAISQAIQIADRDGTVEYAEYLQWMIESIDPNVAERILQPSSVGTAKIVSDEQSDLSQLFAGISKDIKLGTPPQLGLQTMQQYLQAPDVQQRYAQDKAFKDRIDARAKQYQFQLQQQQNAKIGKFGAQMPGPPSQ